MEAAIFADCHALIEDFVSGGSAAFEVFCTKWHKHMFQNIYTEHKMIYLIVQATLVLFHTAKRTLCAKDEYSKHMSTIDGKEDSKILRRIGGLYLMYAIYFKQPTKEYVKISVSLDTWREITTFIDSLKSYPGMNEALYIFWRLYQAEAFLFTALDYHVGLEDLADYDKIAEDYQHVEETEVVRVQAKHKLLLVPEIQETLEEMKTQEDEYNELKTKITKSQSMGVESLPPTKIFSEMHSVFANIKDILEGKDVSITEKNQSINTTRKNLKRKAAGLTNRDYYESSDSSSSSKSPSPSPPSPPMQLSYKSKTELKQKIRKKASTMLLDRLPDILSKDLEESNTEEEVTNQSESESEINEPSTSK
ncbi:proximal sequence element A Pbp45 [Haematobia irritans]|uniref:proximal sequence element A Pbp45 n=1 Tax=Haematobia irritans TaxID=7368 RepID=UPI003F500378